MWDMYWAAQDECTGESEGEVVDASDENLDTCYLTAEAQAIETAQWVKCDPCLKPGKVWVDRGGEVLETVDGHVYPEFANCRSVVGHRGAHDDGFRTWVRLEKAGDGPRSW
jgi:Zn-finger nucleic acid-binding protein